MQSKTSCFNKAVFRKNFTRFAPVWGLYTLALLMGIFLMVDSDRIYRFGYNLTQLPYFMALVNCGYALLTAQLLFGDMYQSRSCYALHAMPLRRETWYVTNVISGLVFSLLPTAVMTLAATAMMSGSAIVSGWQIPLYLFVGVNLQYILFFGMAVLCSFCAGNRLGMVVCYGVLNFLVIGAAIAVQMLYTPMLFGVAFDYESCMNLCPLASMMSGNSVDLMEIVNFSDLINQWRRDDMAYELVLNFKLCGGWSYYWTCAGVGIVMLVGGLLLYRSRKLESAGDLLAVKALEPVFQILVTLAGAAMLQIFYISFNGGSSHEAQYDGLKGVIRSNAYYAFLVIGLVVGWFGGKMLLERSASVFKKKNVPGLLVLAGITAASLVLTALDPMGIATWVPKAEDVKSAAFSQSQRWGGAPMERPGDTENLIRLHELSLSAHVTTKEVEDREYKNYDSFSVIYTMKNGRTARRYYNIWLGTEEAELLRSFKTRPEVVLTDYDNNPLDLEKLDRITISTGGRRNSQLEFQDKEDIASFLEAVTADCEAGVMASGSNYHLGYFVGEDDDYGPQPSVDVYMNASYFSWYVNIYPESRNTLKWIADHDPDGRFTYQIQQGDYQTAWDAWWAEHEIG